MSRTFRTPKGTDLPLLNLRGKEYLEVKYRVVWFREEHPDWSIETEFISVTESSSFAKAIIKDQTGRIMATSHKFEDKKGFPDFIEKSETGATGRALALCGFGTSFCGEELDEGQRIVDSPNERKPTPSPHAPPPHPQPLMASDPGEYVVSIGKKYKGQRIKDIDPVDLAGFIEWLEKNSQKDNKPLSHDARMLKVQFDRWVQLQTEGGGGDEGDGHHAGIEIQESLPL